jgi:hypothetical protein
MGKTCICRNRPPIRSERSGRPADYCARKCAGSMEKRRAQCDRQAAACAEDGFPAINRDDPDRTPEQRAYWRGELDRAGAELGPRP